MSAEQDGERHLCAHAKRMQLQARSGAPRGGQGLPAAAAAASSASSASRALFTTAAHRGSLRSSSCSTASVAAVPASW